MRLSSGTLRGDWSAAHAPALPFAPEVPPAPGPESPQSAQPEYPAPTYGPSSARKILGSNASVVPPSPVFTPAKTPPKAANTARNTNTKQTYKTPPNSGPSTSTIPDGLGLMRNQLLSTRVRTRMEFERTADAERRLGSRPLAPPAG